jgi:hypothetical protein
MAKKSDDSASLMAHGESFENAAWLANMRIAIEKRGLFEPTDGEIQNMRAKIGDSPLFAKLSDTNKAELFRVMLTVRLKLETYDRLSKFEQEHIAGLLRVLGDFVATIPRHHSLLSVVADGISEIRSTTVSEAWGDIRRSVETMTLMLMIAQKIAAQPKAYDKRTLRRRRLRDETITILSSLELFGINVSKTGPGEHQGKGDDGLELLARIIGYTSGVKPSLNALRMRLTRARAHNS